MSEFGELLKELDLKKGELAKLCKVTPETVSRWKDDPPVTVMNYLRQKIKFRDFLVDFGKALEDLKQKVDDVEEL